ncbi:PTS system mannose/fructose/sorbose family transporter subunit IID [Staphylococcus intermedius]|uniref:PTS system, mannose/fructose/N -acetylgalactosamine-specific component IID n=2 Tax=Staphylococcus TaxID=1279 RepID=A0A380G519_STAIN|nr:PTS system mannose/fructose/sorbose family transporter subunit IID [Staphylococcus intermedius]PCF64131.1 PTS fructose transporter subunit IID [Staphylococcus intermedius]PCF78846.1 PTS fructose transporter subunit IID [Staphylococcus intermedius]PCF79819.1 PTS fructose transporter subunit IID [Staphylococcus intermedius]PCF85000.1 PTS fructose transporter subunit IID [Staphylococcus intermedius]PNZ54807.1 PTS fructose transporter subunit IID [Staphylococcus intermedius NCTC 11048]
MTNYNQTETQISQSAEANSKLTGKMPDTPYKLTDKDFRQINLRSLLFFQWGWNYERMQGSGYLYTILPQLRKIYGDDSPELQEMMRTHAQFFNTSNFFNTIIMGIDIAMEEKERYASKESVKGIKVGLMGPFAAVGDAIFGSLVPTIFGAIAANMAQDGNPFGALLWFVAMLAIIVFRWKQLKFAYKEGISLVTTMQHRLESLTNAATLLGVFMVGALVATMIRVQFAWKPQIGDLTVNIQNSADMILPRLLPLLIVFAVYWLLGRKKMNSTRAIFIVIIVSIILSALGVISKI